MTTDSGSLHKALAQLQSCMQRLTAATLTVKVAVVQLAARWQVWPLPAPSVHTYNIC